MRGRGSREQNSSRGERRSVCVCVGGEAVSNQEKAITQAAQHTKHTHTHTHTHTYM